MTNSILNQQLDALLFEETNPIANFSNAAALLFQTIDNISWAGFYFYNHDTDTLDLGPFQGKVACMHIKNGTGVCGTALANKTIQRIDNVHEFPGHIACDSDSNSEIVIPLFDNYGLPIGVLDIDSPKLNRFSIVDEQALIEFSNVLLQHID